MFGAHWISYLCPFGYKRSTLIYLKTTHHRDIKVLCITLVSKYVKIHKGVLTKY